MRVQLNGETREIVAACTIAGLLRELRIESRYCAVELNRRVIPREQHGDTFLSEGDVVEVVTLVGGG
jgi:thiamine biosynthesis protein ThiS